MTTSVCLPRIVEPSRVSLYEHYIDPAVPVVITPADATLEGDGLLSPEGLAEKFQDQPITVSIADGRTVRASPEMEKHPFSDYAAYVQHPPSGRDLRYAAQIPFDQAPDIAGTSLISGILPDTALMKARMLWFGPSGTVAPLHFDESHNFLHQHHGSKHVTLISPTHFESFLPGSKDALDQHMSSIDLSSKHLSSLDDAPQQLEAVLEPGDALFIPAFWWHRVEAIGVSVSVNYWWRPPLRSCLYPAFFRMLSGRRVFHDPSVIAQIVELEGGEVNIGTCRLLSDLGCDFAAAAVAGALVMKFCSSVHEVLAADPDSGVVTHGANPAASARTILDGLTRSGVITRSQNSLLRSVVALGEETHAEAAPAVYPAERRCVIRALVCQLESEFGDLIKV
jgi:hypothetical protein